MDSDISNDRALSNDSVFITKLDNLITDQNNKVSLWLQVKLFSEMEINLRLKFHYSICVFGLKDVEHNWNNNCIRVSSYEILLCCLTWSRFLTKRVSKILTSDNPKAHTINELAQLYYHPIQSSRMLGTLRTLKIFCDLANGSRLASSLFSWLCA